jgi:signal transduction histidine kinase
MPSAQSVPPEGPREVQELARAFNEMNDRVNATQASQREFVANVSHELKTPITSIQGFAQAILDGTAESDASRQQAARIIYDEAGRMHRMVLDLLELARLDAGTLELQQAPVDLPALLRNIAERFTPQAQGAGVSLQVESPDMSPLIGDGDRLAQVFANLVDNAIKNTPAGGQINLSACQIDDQVQVEVSDTGMGIPPEALPHIFERFYQADPARPGGKAHGSGLGLAIVQEIITAHGGTIGVRSTQRPDQPSYQVGSVFTVRLPLHPPKRKTK